MAKTSRGRSQDCKRVAGKQEHELAYMKEKFDITGQALAGAIRAVGMDARKLKSI